MLSRFVPLRIEDAAPFLAAHPIFFLESHHSSLEWLPTYLLNHKYQLNMLWQDGRTSGYFVHR
jgi:hypothetical protein